MCVLKNKQSMRLVVRTFNPEHLAFDATNATAYWRWHLQCQAELRGAFHKCSRGKKL